MFKKIAVSCIAVLFLGMSSPVFAGGSGDGSGGGGGSGGNLGGATKGEGKSGGGKSGEGKSGEGKSGEGKSGGGKSGGAKLTPAVLSCMKDKLTQPEVQLAQSNFNALSRAAKKKARACITAGG